jgi:hypothetical protein
METSLLDSPTTNKWNQSFLCVFLSGFSRESSMQVAIDRVMHTYGMLGNLTLEEEQAAREKVSNFLANAKTDDENKLAVEGLRYLRGVKSVLSWRLRPS